MLRVGRMLGVLRMFRTRFRAVLLMRLGPGFRPLLPLRLRPGLGPLFVLLLRPCLRSLLVLRLRLRLTIGHRRTHVVMRLRFRAGVRTGFGMGRPVSRLLRLRIGPVFRMGRAVLGLRRLGVWPILRTGIIVGPLIIWPGVVIRPIVVAGPCIPRWNRPAEI